MVRPQPILHGQEFSIAPEEIQPRFFQKQTAVDGNCAVCSFNNAMGQCLITKSMVNEAILAEKVLFESSPGKCPIPGKGNKLLSITILEKLARRVGYSISKIRNVRQPQEQFEWILRQNSGQFFVADFHHEFCPEKRWPRPHGTKLPSLDCSICK